MVEKPVLDNLSVIVGLRFMIQNLRIRLGQLYLLFNGGSEHVFAVRHCMVLGFKWIGRLTSVAV